jgi:hypothetical protein
MPPLPGNAGQYKDRQAIFKSSPDLRTFRVRFLVGMNIIEFE